MLAEIRARKQKEEGEDAIDSDTTVDIQPINLWGCGSAHYGRLAKGFRDAESVNSFINCKINFAVHPIRKFTQIACGAGHVLAIGEDKNVYSWGKCHFGQLGHGQRIFDRYLPRKIQNLENVIKIAAQDSASMAINENGELFTWGCGYFGALGLPTEQVTCIPTLVDNNIKFENIFCGKHHAIALSKDKIFGFGLNKNGQLGLGDKLNRLQPSEILDIPFPIVSIGCGDTYTFIVTNGEILLLGYDSTEKISVDVSNVGSRIVQVSCRHRSSIFLSDSGEVYLFLKEKNKLYNGKKFLEELTHVSCGETHFIGASISGKVYTWGRNNDWGKLGHDVTKDPLIDLGSNVFATQVDAGSNHSFVLTRSTYDL